MDENTNYIGVAMGLDVSDLKAGLSEANKQIQLANSEFKAASSGMDDWTKSSEGLNAKIKQLDTVLSMQKSKLAGLKAEYAKVAEEQGENSEAARKLQVQINNQQAVVNKTEKEFNNYKSTLEGVESGQIDLEKVSLKMGKAVEKAGKQTEEAAEKAEKAGEGFTVMKGAIANLVSNGITAFVGAAKNGISALMNLSQETQEYREDLGKLETAWQSAGKTTEQATAIYKDFYSVLGEEDRSIEAVNHLAKFVETEQDMAKWTDICAGVWGTFGDSLPIEGLTEASNESAKTGQVTGVLADALNWAAKEGETFGVKLKANTKKNEEWNKAVKEATTAEEYFNLALEQCTTEQERQALITDTLNGLYSDAASNYKENNKSVIDARKATSEYNDEMAKLGEEMEPVNTEITELRTTLAKKLAPVVKNQVIPAFKSFVKEIKNSGAVEDFSDIVGTLAEKGLPVLSKAISFVVNNIKPLIITVGTAATTFATLNAAMAVANTITATTTAIKGLTTGVSLATKAQTIWNAVMSANPIGAVLTAVGLLTTGIILLATSQDEAKKSTDLLSESQRATVTAAEEAAEAYRETKAAADEMSEAELANIDYTERLWGELKNLADENGKVKEGYEGRAQFILGELNEALGTEYTLNGNIIGQYGEMKKSIEDVILTKKAQVLLTTYEESYKAAIENVAEAERARATQAQELALQEEKATQKQLEYKSALENFEAKVADNRAYRNTVRGSAEEATVGLLKAEAEKEKNILAEKEQAYNNTENELYTYYQDIANYEKASTLVLEGETGKAVTLLNNLGSGFKTVASTAELSADEQKKVLEQQVVDTEVNARLMKEAYEDGVEGVTEEMVDTAEEQARLAKKEFEAVGGDITKGIAEGAEEEEWTLTGAMSGLVDRAVKAAKKAAGIKSPSKLMKDEVGRWLGLGVAKGIEETESESAKAMRETTNGILSAAQKNLSNFKVYHDVSLEDEAYYWDNVRKQIKEGTQARIDADKLYFDALKKNDEKIKKEEEERLKNEQKLLEKTLKNQENFSKKIATIKQKEVNTEQKYTKAVRETWDKLFADIDATQNSYTTALANRTKEIASSMDLLEIVQKNDEKPSQYGMTLALKSQVNALEEWAEQLEKLKSRIGESGLYEELRAMGLDGIGAIETLNNMSDKKLEEYVALWQEKQALAAELATNELAPLKAETEETIKNLKKTAGDELRGLREEYKNELAEIATEFNEIVVEATADGYALGQEQVDEYTTLGQQLIKGIASGFVMGGNSLYEAVKDVINEALKTAQEAADIHSPSRLFRDKIGVFLGKGIGAGVIDSIPSVKNQLGEFMNFVENNLSGIKSGMSVEAKTNGIGTSSAGRSTVIDARQTINYNGKLSRKEIRRQRNDHYTAVKTKLKAEGAI